MIVADPKSRELGRGVLGHLTAISVQHPSLIGSRGALAIANLSAQFPACADAAESCLAELGRTFKSVAKFEKTLVVGGADGCVSVFQRGKCVLAKHMFRSPVTLVSIDPSGKMAVALAKESREAKSFEIPTNGHLCEPIAIRFEENRWDDGMTIVWERGNPFSRYNG
jgi:hypothetical protein